MSAALQALVAKLVQNSMPLEMLIQTYELRRDEVGDFCILNKVLNRTTGEYVASPSVMHFVRDGKAVSLYAREKGIDLRPVAKAMDALICEASGTVNPPNK
jgi:hypothetical protein